MLVVLVPVIFWRKINNEKIDINSDKFKDEFGSLTDGYKSTRLGKCFPFLILAKKFLFAFSLIVLYDIPHLSILLIITLSSV